MTYFLAKSEPNEYSIDDLAKAGEDPWDGVTNPVAVKHLKSMQVGDRVLFYHSGKNPGVVGLAEVSKVAEVDPKNPKSWIPKFKFIRKFETEVSLEEIKTSHKFDDWALVRIGRLSTMPVPDEFITYLEKKGFKL
jgi:predicted RNA-binding protein with PUA-like domain